MRTNVHDTDALVDPVPIFCLSAGHLLGSVV